MLSDRRGSCYLLVGVVVDGDANVAEVWREGDTVGILV